MHGGFAIPSEGVKNVRFGGGKSNKNSHHLGHGFVVR